MSKKQHIPAFTLFEITMVLAIMSVLITIITVSLNRFNEQLKLSTDVQGELNQWYQFRSNLWRELYQSDSLVLEDKVLHIFKEKERINYQVEEEILYRRKADSEWKSTEIAANAIKEQIKENKRFITFDFLWKGDTMKLTYLCDESLKYKMDSYFENLQ